VRRRLGRRHRPGTAGHASGAATRRRPDARSTARPGRAGGLVAVVGPGQPPSHHGRSPWIVDTTTPWAVWVWRLASYSTFWLAQDRGRCIRVASPSVHAASLVAAISTSRSRRSARLVTNVPSGWYTRARPVRPAAVRCCRRPRSWRSPPSGRPAVHPQGDAVEPAAPSPQGRRARRDRHSPVGRQGVAADGANARTRKAWLCFVDESGVKLTPPVRRTWAPRGKTPVLRHPYRRGKQISMCGLVAYRPGAGQGEPPVTWMGFDLLEGAYDTAAFIRVLDGLGHQLGHQPVTVIWDNLGAHHAGATCTPGRPPSRGWSLRTRRRTRRSWTPWRGCGPTCRAASWPTAAAPTAGS
jgi:hypothetical protein